MELLKLLGIVIVIAGFALKLDSILVILVAAVVTALVGGLGPVTLLETLGSTFVANRSMAIFIIVMLVTGTLGDHGITIMSCRESLSFSSGLESDAAPLNHLIAEVLAAAPHTRCFRDPTRGGLASTLNELASQSGTDITVEEDAVPVKPAVLGACEMLGYDPLQVANEGKMVCVVAPDEADAALAAMRANRYGADAAIIGEVASAQPERGPKVFLRTAFGGTRILDMLVGEQLPRIC